MPRQQDFHGISRVRTLKGVMYWLLFNLLLLRQVGQGHQFEKKNENRTKLKSEDRMFKFDWLHFINKEPKILRS